MFILFSLHLKPSNYNLSDMKKILTFLLICITLFANAQSGLLNGTGYAPNFTVTDINGNSHTIYDYLDSGYVMVLELLSTTCGHCQSHAAGTENSYLTNGPIGTDVARFLALEVNAATDSAAVANFASTYGITFSIANNVSPTAINYQLYYTPGYYVIYPDRSYTTICALYCVTAQNYSTIEGLLNTAIAAWVPQVYGCTDSLAINYNPLANITNDSCDYTSYTITTLGMSFSPDTIICDVGDTINFILGGSHNAVEVSDSVWLVNGNTSNGGFSFGFGATGMFIPDDSHTFYYVCQPHASSDMKGVIIAHHPPVFGCTDTTSLNYDSSATIDDGSCCFDNFIEIKTGMTTSSFVSLYYLVDNGGYWDINEYGDSIIVASDDGTDSLQVCLPDGCYEINYSWGTNIDYTVYGYIPIVSVNSAAWQMMHQPTMFAVGSASCPVFGCMDVNVANYDSTATVDDGSCIYNQQQTYVPDDNFEQALINLGYDNILDDSVLTANVNTVTNLNVNSLNINNLTGIEDFTALNYLYCVGNQITSLDLSLNTNLIELDCYNNQLTSLDVSQNTDLIQLSCEFNQITSLDVSANTDLTELSCYNNQLTSLDVSANTDLTELSCYNNQLTSLDVSQNTDLFQLSCEFNQISSLDVSANTDLTWLFCDFNQLTSLDLTNNTLLYYLYCQGNQISSLDLSQNTALTELSCYNNQLTSLDVRNGNNTALIYFDITYNANLYCVDVDNPSWSTSNWTNIDNWASFSANCNSIFGCTDSLALNYIPLANIDDSSCVYTSTCTNPSPTNAYISELIHDRARVNWDNMNDANCMVIQYRIRYRETGVSTWSSKTMSGSGLCVFGLNTTSKKILGLTPSTTYEYYMKAWYCGGGVSGWSAIQNFATADECQGVINFAVTSPTTTKATFTWDTTAAYSFARIKLRPDTTNAVWTTAGGFGVFYPLVTKDKNGLNPGQTYRASARTWCDPSGGAYRSSGWTSPIFWAQPNAIRIEGGSAINNLFIYPNPSRDIFNVSFTLDTKQNLRVKIMNVIGEELLNENLEQFIGEYTKKINLNDNANGVYFFEITTNDGIINKKLILQ